MEIGDKRYFWRNSGGTLKKTTHKTKQKIPTNNLIPFYPHYICEKISPSSSVVGVSEKQEEREGGGDICVCVSLGVSCEFVTQCSWQGPLLTLLDGFQLSCGQLTLYSHVCTKYYLNKQPNQN